MTKTYKSFILFFIVIIFILLFFLKKYNDILNKDKLDILVSKNVELINSEITYQKRHALSLAILFSKNQHIINYLKNSKREKLKKELNSLISIISNYTNEPNIQIQVHTKELKVFVRNWEDKDTGLGLETFRHGLVKVKNTQQPYVSNELGKRFNIKAISPIFDSGKYIGSLEVIMDYSTLKHRLSKVGIEVLPLLDDEFLEIAKYHKNNLKLYNYVVIDQNYNKKLYDIVKQNKNIISKKNFYYQVGDRIITMIPLAHTKGKDIGYLIASFKKSYEDFNYLPKYEYTGGIASDNKYFNESIEKKEIIIK